MDGYRKGAHTVYRLHFHFVFITKYRKPALRGPVGERVRDLIREICAALDIEILRGHVRPDHVHLMLSLPPKVAPSVAMQRIKGKTSHHLLREYRHLHKLFWGRHVFARGYFVATSGNVTDDLLKKYVEDQDVAPSDDDTFKVSG